MYVYAEERNTTHPSMKKDPSQPSVKNDHNKVSKKDLYVYDGGQEEQQTQPSVNFLNLKTIYKQRVQGYWGVKLNFQETYKKG